MNGETVEQPGEGQVEQPGEDQEQVPGTGSDVASDERGDEDQADSAQE